MIASQVYILVVRQICGRKEICSFLLAFWQPGGTKYLHKADERIIFLPQDIAADLCFHAFNVITLTFSEGWQIG